MNVINYHEIAQEVKARKEQAPEVSHKEIISSMLIEKGNQIQAMPHVEQPAQPQQAPVASHLPAYAESESPEIKSVVEHLVTLTLQKGLDEGLRAAKEQDPFILDAYHDALSDTLIEEMKQQKLL